MDEGQRAIRYVLPALCAVIELWLLLLIAGLATLERTLELAIGKGAVGVALTALVASGGMGFLLSIVHHFLYHRYQRLYSVPNHVPLVVRACEKGYLVLYRKEDKTKLLSAVDIEKAVNRDRALRICCMFLYMGDKYPESAVKRCAELHGIMHSLGAALLGAVLATAIVAIVVVISAGAAIREQGVCLGVDLAWPICRGAGAIIFGCVLCGIHYVSVRQCAGDAERLFANFFRHWLQQSAPTTPVELGVEDT